MRKWIDALVALVLLGIAILLGGWSTNGQEDIIAKISVNVITILLPLLVLHTTLMFHLLNEIRKYAENKPEANYNSVLSAIKRNFIEEIVIIVLSLIVLIGKEYCIGMDIEKEQVCETIIWLKSNSPIIANSFVLFSIFYFLWVIIDEVGGCIDLYKKNNQENQK